MTDQNNIEPRRVTEDSKQKANLNSAIECLEKEVEAMGIRLTPFTRNVPTGNVKETSAPDEILTEHAELLRMFTRRIDGVVEYIRSLQSRLEI